MCTYGEKQMDSGSNAYNCVITKDLLRDSLRFTKNEEEMSWCKLHTNITHHEKINRLSKDRRWEWMELICLSNRYGFLLPWAAIEWRMCRTMTEEQYYDTIVFFLSLGIDNKRMQFLEFVPDFGSEEGSEPVIRIRNWEKWQSGTRAVPGETDEDGNPIRKDPTGAFRTAKSRAKKKAREEQERENAPIAPPPQIHRPPTFGSTRTQSDFEDSNAICNAESNDEREEERGKREEGRKKVVTLPPPSPPHWREEAWEQVLKLVPGKLIKNSTKATSLWMMFCDDNKPPAVFGKNNHRALAGIPSYEYFQSVFLPGLKRWLASKEVAKGWDGTCLETFLGGTSKGTSLGYGWLDEWEPAIDSKPAASASLRKAFSADEDEAEFLRNQQRVNSQTA